MKLYLLAYCISDLVYPRIEDYDFKIFPSENRAKGFLKMLEDKYSNVDYLIESVDLENLDLYVRY